MEQVADGPGVPIEVQRARLRTLAMRHSIPPVDALRLGLVHDGWPHRWAEFVFDCEEGWNVAASEQGGKSQLRLLGDKVETTQRLAAAGIACPEGVRLGPTDLSQTEVAVLVDRWLRRWPQVHGKRRFGSRGEGAFEITSGNGAVGLAEPVSSHQVAGDPRGPDLDPMQKAPWTLREYHGDAFVGEPLVWLRQHLAASEHLIQPRLVSHKMFYGVASSSDVVTVRLVTRQVGRAPEVFSVVLEVPLPFTEGRRSYVLLRVDAEGLVTGPVRPQWLRQPSADKHRGATGARQAEIVKERLVGLRLPEFAGLAADGLRAHELFPGLFAVAWDVAVTETGYLCLEGNAGFATRVPQWVSGGLLAGLD